MMSAILISSVKTLYAITSQNSDNVEDEEDMEHISLRIALNHDGKLLDTNQFHDYFYRASSLAHMSFYHFCLCVKIQKITDHTPTVDHDSHGNCHRRHQLVLPHKLSKTHQLVEFRSDLDIDTETLKIPKVVGCSIPQPNAGEPYYLFMVSHFKPFGIESPLLKGWKTFQEEFENFPFTDRALHVMKNWDAIHECEDARDSERLKRRAALSEKSMATANSILNTMTDNLDEEVLVEGKNKKTDFCIQQDILKLNQADWLIANPTIQMPSVDDNNWLPKVTGDLLKRWKNSKKEQEECRASAQHNKQDVKIQTLNPHFIAETVRKHDIEMIGKECSPTYQAAEYVSVEITSKDPESVINSNGCKFHLNRMQWVAFRIMARSFIRRYLLELKEELVTEPLRMLLTGPGGTGKTHVVKALRGVMAEYGCQHLLRFLAPTGSAASLIEGMTIHKGFGIKVKSKGKSNCKLGESEEDYTILISVRDRTKLRDEWHFVKVLLIDEISLLSVQLMCEVDHALRYATENHGDWFGGITVIFAGDFFQHPPIGGTPLYNPISNTPSKLADSVPRRLGHLAWKSLNAVIELTEQERMKEDVEYADAVNRLRTRDCNLGDVDLFNSRVIKSASNPQGINMGTVENINATCLVATNHLRETINMRKAYSNTNLADSPDFVLAAAEDKILLTPQGNIPNILEALLALDISGMGSNEALPGFLPLYVGMPVILRYRNPSTELGIANGSQGYVRQINMKNLSEGRACCTSTLVEFPLSTTEFPHLPPKFFPIEPISWTFSTIIDGEKIHATRHQLPLQPGFAVTIHSAQGKTLPKILINMGENAFGAYVGASRATTRKGLALMNKVSLNDLTHEIPYSLFFENMRFKILQHNTLIKYGFTANKLQDVPDAESEKKMNLSPSIATFDFEPLKPKKNKNHPTSEESAPPPPPKKIKIMQIKNNPLAVDEGTYAKSQNETTSLHGTLLKHKTSSSSMT